MLTLSYLYLGLLHLTQEVGGAPLELDVTNPDNVNIISLWLTLIIQLKMANYSCIYEVVTIKVTLYV